jgi:hypothetical protein
MKNSTSTRGAGSMKLAVAMGMGTVAMLVLSGSASAQEAGGQATVGATATTTTTTTTAPAAPVVVAEPEREHDRDREPRARVHVRHERDDDSPDHERFVGRFGVGYFGVSQLPIATGPGGGGAPAAGNVNAPVIGVRWWLQPNLGIDMGIGIGFSTGSTEVANGGGTTSVDKPSLFGMAVHGGVPLAFAHGRHYSFLVIPEATIGFATGTIKETGANPIDQNLSGFKLDLGGRIGAEIHFGFIGIPELSLEGSVGVYLRREAIKWKRDTVSASDGTTTFGTNVQSDPWALFVNNISAFYYF